MAGHCFFIILRDFPPLVYSHNCPLVNVIVAFLAAQDGHDCEVFRVCAERRGMSKFFTPPLHCPTH